VRPLEDITLVELAGLGPVPFAGMILAGMGADVILVDRPGGPPVPDVMLGAVGRGKRSIAIDLKHAEGPAVMLRLAQEADVVIEGFRPGVAERLGVGPDDCLAANPDLVYGRMTGWGRSGPLSAMAGHDINYVGISGALDAIGDEDRSIPPLNLVGDYGGGAMYLVAGVLAALLDRDRSGGRVVEAAMVDGAASLMASFYEMHAAGLWGDTRASNLLDGGAPFYTTYATGDGEQMAVGALEPQFYEELLAGLGLDGADLPDRLDRSAWPELRRRFGERFAARTRADWESIFMGTDACVTPVLGMDEAPFHPANIERGVFGAETGHPLPSPAPRFAGDPSTGMGAAPTPGRHTDEILARVGFDPDDVARLRADHVVG
jgi:alpha-methylacyl-CoA racemase